MRRPWPELALLLSRGGFERCIYGLARWAPPGFFRQFCFALESACDSLSRIFIPATTSHMGEFVGEDVPVIVRNISENSHVQHCQLRFKISEGERFVAQVALLHNPLPA